MTMSMIAGGNANLIFIFISIQNLKDNHNTIHVRADLSTTLEMTKKQYLPPDNNDADSFRIAIKHSWLRTIISLTHKDATDIVINCKQKDMYTMLGVQRSSFINTLTELQSDGIIDFTSTEIFIKDRERLADILSFEN